MSPRPMIQQEHEQGYYLCGCGRYAHVFKAAVLARMHERHPDYHGERCPECNLWMVAVDKLPQGEAP